MAIEIQSCPECGRTLPRDSATRGLCPRCLMRSALVAADDTSAAGRLSSTPRLRPRFVAPPPEELAAAFPQFEVLELLGQGGMGVVYKARQRSLDRVVALKVIPQAIADDPAFVERFHREARTLAKLSHPNIVTAFDFGQVEDCCYFVMEFVDGWSLREASQQRRLRPDEVIHVARQTCDALDYAHRLGVVHRDIKPENILLVDPPGLELEDASLGLMGGVCRKTVKLADFGLAKLVEQSPADLTLTPTAHVLGTPLYMAPEQIERPGEIDHRADVYSLGVVLYELLTGELPLGRFDDVSSKAVVDPRLDRLVLRCLEKDPAERYQEVSELKLDLEAMNDTPRGAAAPGLRAGRPARRRRWLAAAGLLGLAAAIVALAAWIIKIRIDGDSAKVEVAREGVDPPEDDLPTGGIDETQGKTPSEPGRQAKPSGTKTPPVTRYAGPKVDFRQDGSVRIPGAFVHRGAMRLDLFHNTEVELFNARIFGQGEQRTLRVDYRSRGIGMRMSARYVLVIESDSGQVIESRLLWHGHGQEGTLRHTFAAEPADVGPWELYLEAEEMGLNGGRRRVSNIIRLGDDREADSETPTMDSQTGATP